jgi:hypothetical protein
MFIITVRPGSNQDRHRDGVPKKQGFLFSIQSGKYRFKFPAIWATGQDSIYIPLIV